ncbi:heat shock 70 kDa protein 12A-like [Mercenaria mercenaria]|uniref:heat shock 70 kDa protein 12A-like n=1 Tax=Mercenaria mercenaria TaxID=6596 RepID=UPI00234E60C6|nr:heat shock 70 kDa protein 12A-like [Mercenaria mercenaria]
MGSNPSKSTFTDLEIKQESVNNADCDYTANEKHNNVDGDNTANDKQKNVGGDNTANDKQNNVAGPLVVIAIDFGTVYSGFAYSFHGNEQEITSAKHGTFLEEDRVPTIILLNPDQTFHSFGYDAQRKYHELRGEVKQNYFYIEHFKIALYKTNEISRNIDIYDITGKAVKAMKVFSVAIENLKNLALRAVSLAKLDLSESSIQWMITIPAISSDSARQFMREAARDAGIPENQLRLVLEPEAAALYCQRKMLVVGDRLPVGFKYILADLGGGTSDLCVHEVLDNDKLREVYRATGEIAGGTNVDNKFLSLMEELVGDQVWAEFQSDYPSAYIDLINNFHRQKKIFSAHKKMTILKMENALVYVLEQRMDKTFSDLIKMSKYVKELEFLPTEARFIVYRDLMQLFFETSLDNIINLVNKILKECTGSIDTLMLVGGYSESPYLRERIQSEFTNKRVVLVEDARLAVLNGAVTMGWKPKNIIQRRSRFTYGVAAMKPFVEGEHPESLKFIEDGQVWCKLVFEKMIEKGQIVEYGQTFIFEGYSTVREPEEKHKERDTSLWRSTRENPQYCIEEENCSLVGYILCKPPPEGWPDYWRSEAHLIVGETEFTVKYFNLTTGHEYETQMDFL